MAFSNPAGCYNQCYSDVCSSYVAPNEVWNYNATGAPFPTGSGDTIHDENVERLALSVNDERSRRGMGAYAFDPFPDGSDEFPPAGGDIIQGNSGFTQEFMLDIKTAINQISAGIVTYTVTDGNPVTWTQINQARNKINNLRAACLCNTDCGANSVCSCWYDCGTNYYSDERLKEDIRSL